MSHSKKLMTISLFMLTVLTAYAPLSCGVQEAEQNTSRNASGQPSGNSWQDAFEFVRDEIRFEPTAHLMKPPRAVLWGRSGNSGEQALLLSTYMEELGIESRMVTGRIDDERAASLIRSMFPERDNFSYAPEVPVSRPAEDGVLLDRAAEHHWLQIRQGEKWLDLDPSFPEAEPGKAYADVEETHILPPDRLHPKMHIALRAQVGNRKEDVLNLEQNLHEMTNRPVSLSISPSFRETEGKEKSGGGGFMGGGFGSLGGGSSKKKKAAKGLEVTYRAVLRVKETEEASGTFVEKLSGSTGKASSRDAVKGLWLTFRLTVGGATILESERTLFEKVGGRGEIPLFQRHSILIAPGIIPREELEKELATVTDDGLTQQLKSAVDEIKKRLEAGGDSEALLSQSISLEEKLGSGLGHLVNMIFAHSSDTVTTETAEALSVAAYFALPRIIITSVEGNGEDVRTVIDLRQDSIEAIPYPGQALNMGGTFQYGRGVSESVLEGKALEVLLGKPSLTTAYIMREAAGKNIPIRFFSIEERSVLKKLRMPRHVTRRATEALKTGAVLAIPERSVSFDGEDRWGWWQVNPRTQEVVGVLDTGLHQAMIQRTILDTEGMVSSKMGFAIGAITGAVDTQWMLATMVLKYGDINKEALEEIKAYMKQLKNYMCPDFERSASVTIASASIEIEDCYKKEIAWQYEGGVKVEMGWCQAFAKGFGCASTTILNGYLGRHK